MLKKIKDTIWGISLVRNTIKLSASSAFMVLLPLIVTPILSRLYTPEDYGAWGIFSSILYIVTSFIFLSYENTIVKTNEDSDIPSLLVLCLLVAFGIICLVAVVFVGGRWGNFTFFVEFPSILLLVLSLFSNSINTLCGCIANREKRYGVLAVSNIINGISQAVFRILFAFTPIISYGLIIGNLLAQVTAATFLIFQLLFVLKKALTQNITWNHIKAVAQKNKKFPLFDAPARFIEFAIGNLAVIILAFFWSREEIGCYSMIIQFILMPIAIVGSAMGNVFYKELSENIQDSHHIAVTTERAAKISFFISLLPILFLTFGGDKILVLYLGKQWESSGIMALCMVIYSLPVILSEPLLPTFRSLEKQEVRFNINILCFCLSLGSLLISSFLTKNIFIALIIYSTLYASVRLLMFFIILRLTKVSIMSVSKYFYVILVSCYAALAIRLFYELT